MSSGRLHYACSSTTLESHCVCPTVSVTHIAALNWRCVPCYTEISMVVSWSLLPAPVHPRAGSCSVVFLKCKYCYPDGGSRAGLCSSAFWKCNFFYPGGGSMAGDRQGKAQGNFDQRGHHYAQCHILSCLRGGRRGAHDCGLRQPQASLAHTHRDLQVQ